MDEDCTIRGCLPSVVTRSVSQTYIPSSAADQDRPCHIIMAQPNKTCAQNRNSGFYPSAAGCGRTGRMPGSAPLPPILRVRVLNRFYSLRNLSKLTPGVSDHLCAGPKCTKTCHLELTCHQELSQLSPGNERAHAMALHRASSQEGFRVNLNQPR